MSSSRPAASTKAVGTQVISNPALIQVNPRQQNNPLLRFIPRQKWQIAVSESNPLLCDYCTGTTGIVYCELEYHRRNSSYIRMRIAEVGKKYRLRVLLVWVNDADPSVSSLREILLDLNKVCFQNNFTLVLSQSQQEAARYIEAFKTQDQKPATSIQEKEPRPTALPVGSSTSTGARPKAFNARTSDNMLLPLANRLLCTVRSVNKANVVSLLDTVRCVRSVMSLDLEQLMLMTGIGEKRATRLHDVFSAPFKKSRKTLQTAMPNAELAVAAALPTRASLDLAEETEKIQAASTSQPQKKASSPAHNLSKSHACVDLSEKSEDTNREPEAAFVTTPVLPPPLLQTLGPGSGACNAPAENSRRFSGV